MSPCLVTSVATVLVLSWATAAATELSPRLQPVPRPATNTLPTADQQKLQEAREQFERLRREEGGYDELAEACGRLGSLYLLYDFPDAARPALENARALAPETFAWHYYLGVLHRRQGELEAARRSLEQALALRPGDLAVRIRLGRVLVDSGLPEEAAEQFRKALEIDSRSAAAHAGLGEAASELGSPSRATRHLRRAVELQPTATVLHHELGLAYRAIGDTERAREHLRQNTYQPVVFPDPLMDSLTSQLESARDYLKRGNRALADNQVDVALELYRRGVETDPQDPLLRYNLAVALAKGGRRREAIEQLRSAVELDPGYRNAHYNLAVALKQEGDYEAAARHFERAYRIDPGDHDAHLEWAVALLAAGQGQHAAEELESVLHAAVSERPAVAARAAVELGALAADRGDGEAAEMYFRRAVELDAELPEARLGLAHSLARAGRLREAADEFLRVVELTPTESEPRFGAAMALMLAGEDTQALGVLEAGLRALPGNPELTHALARLLAASPEANIRDGPRALELARDLVRQHPSLDHAETLAMAYAETGDFTRALTWQRRVVTRARRTGRADMAERAQARLELYERERPARAPWQEDSG